MFLVGDVVGFVDLIIGEGIVYVIKLGYLVVEVVIEVFKVNILDCVFVIYMCKFKLIYCNLCIVWILCKFVFFGCFKDVFF